MHWNHFYSDAPHDSDAWAASDRGWLHLSLTEHPDCKSDSWYSYGFDKNIADDAPTACGNYLYYNGRGYHAVAYILGVSRAGISSRHIDIPGGPWYQTREEAAEAIQRAVINHINLPVQMAL